jgi:hypothetical protein
MPVSGLAKQGPLISPQKGWGLICMEC